MIESSLNDLGANHGQVMITLFPSEFFSILSPTVVKQAAQRYSYLSPSGKTNKSLLRTGMA
jgi:hypothetical protein